MDVHQGRIHGCETCLFKLFPHVPMEVQCCVSIVGVVCVMCWGDDDVTMLCLCCLVRVGEYIDTPLNDEEDKKD